MIDSDRIRNPKPAGTLIDRVGWRRLIESFPRAERFGLTDQMRRAAVSVSSNVAEGCSRSSAADYARFLELATGSLFEVVSQVTIGRNRKFLNSSDYQQIYDAALKQCRMLSGLRKSLEPL